MKQTSSNIYRQLLTTVPTVELPPLHEQTQEKYPVLARLIAEEIGRREMARRMRTVSVNAPAADFSIAA